MPKRKEEKTQHKIIMPDPIFLFIDKFISKKSSRGDGQFIQPAEFWDKVDRGFRNAIRKPTPTKQGRGAQPGAQPGARAHGHGHAEKRKTNRPPADDDDDDDDIDLDSSQSPQGKK